MDIRPLSPLSILIFYWSSGWWTSTISWVLVKGFCLGLHWFTSHAWAYWIQQGRVMLVWLTVGCHGPSQGQKTQPTPPFAVFIPLEASLNISGSLVWFIVFLMFQSYITTLNNDKASEYLQFHGPGCATHEHHNKKLDVETWKKIQKIASRFWRSHEVVFQMYPYRGDSAREKYGVNRLVHWPVKIVRCDLTEKETDYFCKTIILKSKNSCYSKKKCFVPPW